METNVRILVALKLMLYVTHWITGVWSLQKTVYRINCRDAGFPFEEGEISTSAKG